MIAKGHDFPNLFFKRTDGTSFELWDLRRQKHAFILLVDEGVPEARAFVDLFQSRSKLFDWLGARLIPVFRGPKAAFSPWPAPDYPPCLLTDPVPEGLGWGKGYVVSRNGTLLEIYADAAELSVEKVERDLLYWEAGHCLPS